MKRAVVLLGLAVLLVVSTRAQQPPPNAPRFTGKTEAMDGKDLSVARRRFEPGARTAWHSHDRGQLLMVEEGRMRAAAWPADQGIRRGRGEYTARECRALAWGGGRTRRSSSSTSVSAVRPSGSKMFRMRSISGRSRPAAPTIGGPQSD